MMPQRSLQWWYNPSTKILVSGFTQNCRDFKTIFALSDLLRWWLYHYIKSRSAANKATDTHIPCCLDENLWYGQQRKVIPRFIGYRPGQWRSQAKNVVGAKKLGGGNTWFRRNSSILFRKTPLKAQNDYIF